jgi:outer membrane protein assembly factor BamA
VRYSRLVACALSFYLLNFACMAAPLGQATTTPKQEPPASASSPILFGTNVDLQGSSGTSNTQLGLGAWQGKEEKKKKKKKGELAVAPIPLVNPSIGNGGGLGVLYAVHLGEQDTSPASSFGVGGFGTGRGSWGFGLGARLYLKDDKYRIMTGGGLGEINYNYFGTGTAGGNAGISIPLSQRSKAFLIEPKIRVFRNWYAGPRYHLIANKVSLNPTKFDVSNLPLPPPADLDLRTAALGGRVQRDTSDSPFYPRKGSVFDTLVDFYGSGVGGQREYQNVTSSFNKYLGLGGKNVFAIHGLVCLVTNKAPFYDVCELGQSQDLRGYQVGQFRDNRMIVGQAEYRRDLVWRLGAVAFAGAGAVAHTWGGFGNAQPEPGGGVGLRYTLAKRNHINLRADYAWGNGSHATYISLGEAF